MLRVVNVSAPHLVPTIHTFAAGHHSSLSPGQVMCDVGNPSPGHHSVTPPLPHLPGRSATQHAAPTKPHPPCASFPHLTGRQSFHLGGYLIKGVPAITHAKIKLLGKEETIPTLILRYTAKHRVRSRVCNCLSSVIVGSLVDMKRRF